MRIAKGNDWNIDIRRFFDGFVISVWIGNEDESWLFELSSLIVSESTWSPFGLVRDIRSSEFGELDDSSLTSGLGRNSQDIPSIWNGSNDSGSQENLVIGLGNVEVNISRLTDQGKVSSHLAVVVLTGNMTVGLDESKVISFSLTKVLNGLHNLWFIKILIFRFIMDQRSMIGKREWSDTIQEEG